MCQIKGEYVRAKQITPIVKKALASRWGFRNVSVTTGKGTACGWIHADLTIPKPLDCHCQPNESYCDRCREAKLSASAEARKRVEVAMEHEEAKFGRFTSDDGYNSEHEEFILQVYLARD